MRVESEMIVLVVWYKKKRKKKKDKKIEDNKMFELYSYITTYILN